MSVDAVYILVYEPNNYLSPTPMEKDRQYLLEKWGGEFEEIGGSAFNIFWRKPKYRIYLHELKNLMADQILERVDCELWEIVK